MRVMIFIFTSVLFLQIAKAVIMLPGKIESPERAEAIISQKYQAKKALLEKNRQRIKEKFARKIQSDRSEVLAVMPDVVSSTSSSSHEENDDVHASGVAGVGSGNVLPEIKESSQ